MPEKIRLTFKCWNQDCPQPDETYTLLIEPSKEKSLLLIACPYCGKEAEVDLTENRSTTELIAMNPVQSTNLEAIDINQVLQTRPRSQTEKIEESND